MNWTLEFTAGFFAGAPIWICVGVLLLAVIVGLCNWGLTWMRWKP